MGSHRKPAPAWRKVVPFGAPAKGPLRGVGRPSWKLVGLAGIAGVAATGVVVARSRRAQRELPPDELRSRLHQRLADAGDGRPLAEAGAGPAPGAATPGGPPPAPLV